jgi:hypothetical protein
MDRAMNIGFWLAGADTALTAGRVDGGRQFHRGGPGDPIRDLLLYRGLEPAHE